MLVISADSDQTVPWAIANASYKKQKRNQGVTEIVKMVGRGHSLTIEAGWREVAEKALEFVKRFRRECVKYRGQRVRPGSGRTRVPGRNIFEGQLPLAPSQTRVVPPRPNAPRSDVAARVENLPTWRGFRVQNRCSGKRRTCKLFSFSCLEWRRG